MDLNNLDYELIFKKTMANIQTNINIIKILENSDKILCPQSAAELAEIYYETEYSANTILQNQKNIAISDELFLNLIFSHSTNMELIEEISELDYKNGGNLKMCLDAIKNNKTLNFSDFTEKADMIHMNFTNYEEKKSLKNTIRKKLDKI